VGVGLCQGEQSLCQQRLDQFLAQQLNDSVAVYWDAKDIPDGTLYPQRGE
jgi:hypothetical protein